MSLRAFTLHRITTIAPRYLPFAEVARLDVPLPRLLRLSLFQVTVGMALVLLVGTLNRVMIVELEVPALLVAGMLALPLLFAPFRTLIGFKSDTHRSALGLRRVPYIWKGTLYQFGGFAIMPFALLTLSGYGEAVDAPRWLGLSSAALAFLLVGAGVHMVQTVGLALATDLVKEEDHPKIVGLMYVMLSVGHGGERADLWCSAGGLHARAPGSGDPGHRRADRIAQSAGVVETGSPRPRPAPARWSRRHTRPSRMRLPGCLARPGTVRLLVLIGLGTFGFGMADVLLEPYGGQALGLSVADTTKLTAVLALGHADWLCRGLSRNRAWAARLRASQHWARRLAFPGFAAIILSVAVLGAPLFVLGDLCRGRRGRAFWPRHADRHDPRRTG